MTKILIAECKQEVSTFNPHMSGYDDFGIRRGEELLSYHRTVRNEIGGISEERRIAWMAQEHGVRFIPHGWNTAVGLAADLQLASAFHGTDLVEYLTGSPFIDEITVGGWKLDAEGMLAIPTNPGLGLELDRDAVKRYTRGEKLL